MVGTFLKLPRHEVVDVLAGCGFDFVCDYEHAQMSERDVAHVIRAGRAAVLPFVVRIPDLERGLINRLLEAGAAGIQLARAEPGAARRLRDVMHYPPGYETVPLTTFMPATNEQILMVGQFETAADPDATVARLDVAFMGPVDLRFALGTPGPSGTL